MLIGHFLFSCSWSRVRGFGCEVSNFLRPARGAKPEDSDAKSLAIQAGSRKPLGGQLRLSTASRNVFGDPCSITVFES